MEGSQGDRSNRLMAGFLTVAPPDGGIHPRCARSRAPGHSQSQFPRIPPVVSIYEGYTKPGGPGTRLGDIRNPGVVAQKCWQSLRVRITNPVRTVAERTILFAKGRHIVCYSSAGGLKFDAKSGGGARHRCQTLRVWGRDRPIPLDLRGLETAYV